MTTLREHEKKAGIDHRPPRVVELPLTALAVTAEGRPVAPLQIGLRLPSEDDRQQARNAALDAVGLDVTDPEDRISIFNDALMRELLTTACCLITDERQPFFANGSLELGRRLTTEGVRLLWQELDALELSSRVSMSEATDEGFSHLIAMWDRGVAFDFMPPEEATRMRRLIEFVRQEMADAEERASLSGVILATG